MLLQDQLRSDLNTVSANGSDAEPPAEMFIDTSGVFWITPSGHYLFMQGHAGIDEYVDVRHELVENNDAPEGVGAAGVFWMNTDFQNPYHISEFESRIETVNAII